MTSLNFNHIFEFVFIFISRRLTVIWKRIQYRKNNVEDGEEKTIYTRWEQDYNLQNITQLDLVDEYLEMVIQYGFITLFVAGKFKIHHTGALALVKSTISKVSFRIYSMNI